MRDPMSLPSLESEGHQPGKPAKVGEFDSDQEQVVERLINQGKVTENVFCLWHVTMTAMVTEQAYPNCLSSVKYR